jgi:CRISPR-associated protein Cas2
MQVIFIYDIDLTDEKKGQKRLNKVRKIGRKYLTHIQKSVFEGELTEGKLAKMEAEVLKVIEKDKDSVIFYTIPDGVKINRKLITDLPDPTKNVL